jgi:hypothetical protein
MREIELYVLGFACNAARPSGSGTAMRRLSLGRLFLNPRGMA